MAIRVRRRLCVTGKRCVTYHAVSDSTPLALLICLRLYLVLIFIAGTFAACLLSFGSECKLVLFVLFEETCSFSAGFRGQVTLLN